MSTFNAYGQKAYSFGGNTPIWLGNVTRVPVGGVLADAFCKAGILIPAGTPVNLKNGVLTPLAGWEVVSVDSDSHAITVKPNSFGVKPSVGDCLVVIGATFATTGAAAKVSAVAESNGNVVITMTDAKLDGTAAGKILAISTATNAAASGAAMANQPNGYLYHDIYIDAEKNGVTVSNKAATGAVVNVHAEGILIQRNEIANAVASQMAVAVPGVIQING